MRQPVRSDRGQTIVEFAICSLLFFMVIFGVAGFGIAVWRHNLVSDLAQEGARWASVRGSTATSPATDATVQAFVQGRATGLMTPLPTSVTTWPSGSAAPGGVVRVVVSHTFTPAMAFVPTMTFQSQAEMIIAR